MARQSAWRLGVKLTSCAVTYKQAAESRLPHVKSLIIATISLLLSAVPQLCAQQDKKPPLNVPQNATLFNGKWYYVYLEKGTWRRAQEKCRKLGGNLACVHDGKTQDFIRTLSKGLDLWLGATDEKVEGLWMWVDGQEMTYKAWFRGGPEGGRKSDYLLIGWGGRGWADRREDFGCVGFICEWAAK